MFWVPCFEAGLAPAVTPAAGASATAPATRDGVAAGVASSASTETSTATTASAAGVSSMFPCRTFLSRWAWGQEPFREGVTSLIEKSDEADGWPCHRGDNPSASSPWDHHVQDRVVAVGRVGNRCYDARCRCPAVQPMHPRSVDLFLCMGHDVCTGRAS